MVQNLKKTFLRSGILILILLVFFKWINVVETVKNLNDILIWPLFVAFAFYTAMQIIKADRFYSFSKSIGEKFSQSKNIFIHLFMPLLGRLTPGKVGEATKIFLLHADRKKLLFLAIVEKIVDFIVLGVLALFVIFIDTSYIWYYFSFLLILAIIILFLMKSEWLLNKVTFIFLKRKIFEDKWFILRCKKLKKGILVRVFYTTFIGWFANFVACYFLAKSLHMSISLFILGPIFAAAIIIGLVSSLPGGFGAREVSLIVLLQLVGISESTAQAYSLLYVFFILGSETILAMIGYGLYVVSSRKKMN